MPVWTRLIVFLVGLLLALPSGAQVNPEAEGALAGANLLLDTVKSARESNVQFSGARSFKDEEIRAAIGEQVREIDEKGVSPARADDAAYYVASFYRKAGYSKVETSFTITGRKVTVRINEGPRTLLRSLDFMGNRAFPDDVLFEYMIGAKPARLKKEPELFPYNQNEVNAGADRVRGYYVSEGYLDVLVDASKVNLSRDGRSATVVVRIDERTRYTFGGILFDGEPVFSRSELIAATREKADGAFSRTKAISMQRNLESFYRSRGYFNVDVQLSAEPVHARGGRVPVRFTVKPGAIYRFDGVTAKNLTPEKPRLRESFLPRRFQHLRGQLYNPEKVDETYRELLRSGLFSNLRYNPTALPDRTVRLDFTFEEAKSKEVGFTLGFGTYDGFKTGVRLADRNLFGNGRPLTLDADWSQRGLDAELMYVDPWFLENPKLNMRAKIFSADRTEKGYMKNEVGGRIEFGWRALPHLELSAFGHTSKVKITESDIDPLLLGPTNYDFATIGVGQTTDFRDNPIAPTRGWIVTSAVDVGTIDGQRAFTRSIARVSYYKPLGKMQLALGARAGLILPVDEGIPIDIRFFNGGATTVRSFSERDLGPKDNDGHPLGGEFFTVFNAELTFPIVGGLQGAVFVDAGNLRSHTDLGVQDMRYAVGLGLRYALPVGPIRLDYGVNPDRREDEDFGAFHFSFGMAF
jgi:outer membrane protein insertion porin family